MFLKKIGDFFQKKTQETQHEINKLNLQLNEAVETIGIKIPVKPTKQNFDKAW